jgi:hypothetical protein
MLGAQAFCIRMMSTAQNSGMNRTVLNVLHLVLGQAYSEPIGSD